MCVSCRMDNMTGSGVSDPLIWSGAIFLTKEIIIRKGISRARNVGLRENLENLPR